jgi:Coenzyme PQQ synthesis protein D (PqqD)
MKSNRYVARSTAIAARALGNETMVMSAANSTLFTLDEIATVIWDAADGSMTLEEIVTTKICAQYDVTPEAALKDAELFAQQLAAHGLLLLSDQPIARSSSSPKVNP